jgi:hypothetical protein
MSWLKGCSIGASKCCDQADDLAPDHDLGKASIEAVRAAPF